MVNKQYDVVIVGAGPAGSSAAIRLARAGRRVLLVEQKKFPREKLCGEFISPECLEHFSELGVSTEIERVGPAKLRETVFYSRTGNALHICAEWLAASQRNALGLSRTCLDQILVERACESGVDFLEETTGIPVFADGRLEGLTLRYSDSSEESILAELAIDATGRNRGLSRGVEINGKADRAEYVAFKTRLRDANIDSDACELYAYSNGYGGCSEVENGFYNLCFIIKSAEVKRLGNDPELIWRETMLKNSRAKEALGSASVEGEWLAVPITKLGVGDPTPAKGLLSVGDAASFIDPFTGSGIALALESSRLAAATILENNSFEEIAAAYRREYDGTLKRRMRFSSYIRMAGRSGWVADSLIWLLSRSERLRKLAAETSRLNDAN